MNARAKVVARCLEQHLGKIEAVTLAGKAYPQTERDEEYTAADQTIFVLTGEVKGYLMINDHSDDQRCVRVEYFTPTMTNYDKSEKDGLDAHFETAKAGYNACQGLSDLRLTRWSHKPVCYLECDDQTSLAYELIHPESENPRLGVSLGASFIIRPGGYSGGGFFGMIADQVERENLKGTCLYSDIPVSGHALAGAIVEAYQLSVNGEQRRQKGREVLDQIERKEK